jgi:hypothetical protein
MTFDVEFNPDIAFDVLRDIRSKVRAIREPVREALKGPITDEVRAFVDEYIAPYPAADPIHPFQFATPRSRAWYFAAMRLGFFTTQQWDDAGGQWQRTYTLHDAWQVETNMSANEGFISIKNEAVDEKGDTYPKAVLGPDAVPGHAEIWDADPGVRLDELSAMVEEQLLDALDEALSGFQSRTGR